MDTKQTAEQFEEAGNVLFTQLGELMDTDPNAPHDLHNMLALTDLVRTSLFTSQLVIAHDGDGRREWMRMVLEFKKKLDAIADNYRQGGNHEEITA